MMCPHAALQLDGRCYWCWKIAAGLLEALGPAPASVIPLDAKRFIGLEISAPPCGGWHDASQVDAWDDEPSNMEVRIDRARAAGRLPVLEFELSEQTANAVARS